MGTTRSVRLAIHSVPDVITARQHAREMSETLGCLGTTLVLITAVVSEVARKVAEHPLPGEMLLTVARSGQDVIVTMTIRVHYADRTAGVEIRLDQVPLGCAVAHKPDHTVVTLMSAVEAAGGRPLQELENS